MILRASRPWLIWPFLALCWAATAASAAQVLAVSVTHDGARFLIGMRISIDATPAAVFRALQDYPAMAHYNPDLRTVRVERPLVPGRVRLFTSVHTCVLIFCKTMRQEEIMTATTNAGGGVLRAQLLAHGGDFLGGGGRWTVEACRDIPEEACLHVRIELVPGFWVPPVIGPWVIRRKMEEEAQRTGVGLERTAQLLSRTPPPRAPGLR